MADIYESITNRVIELMETADANGSNPFKKLSEDGKYNYKTKRAYSLLNSLLLPKKGGYLTFKQTLDMGGKPKKGSKTYPVYFFTIIKKTKDDGTEDELPILRFFNVFHIDDVEGIKFDETVQNDPQPIDEIEDVIDGYIERTNINLEYVDKDVACYTPKNDTVTIGDPNRFEDAESYYGTLFHELAHSTGTLERLHRKEIVNGAIFGDADYSREELTAELASCMIMHHFGASPKSIKRSADYIKSWIKALKNDKRMIVYASSRAEKACKYILTGEEPQY